MKRLFAALLLTLTFTTLFAAEPRIEGTLKDADGATVEFACIRLLHKPDSMLLDGAITAADGRFSLARPDLPALLHISALGFEEMYILDPEANLGDITLRAASFAIGEVVVVGNEPVSTLTDEGNVRFDIGRIKGNPGADITGTLNRLPGVTANEKQGLTLNGQRATLYIDGRKQNLSAAQAVSLLKAMPVESVDNVELTAYTGAGYDAAGGPVINIVTTRRKDDGWNLSLNAAGTADRENHWDGGGSAYLAARRGNVNIYSMLDYANGVVSYIQRDSTLLGTTDYLLENRDSHSRTNRYSAMANVEWQVRPRHTLNFNLYAYRGNLNSDTADTATDSASAATTAITDGRTDDDLLSGTIEYSADFKNDLKLKVNYGIIHMGERNRADYRLDNTSIRNAATTRGTQHILKADLTRRFKRTQLAAGLKAELGNLRNETAYSGNTPSWLEPENRFHARENIFAAHANVSHRFGERFSMNAGVRGEVTDYRTENITADESARKTYVNLFPSLSFTHRAGKVRQTLYLLSGIHRPDYDCLYPGRQYVTEHAYTVGNPHLAPQKAVSVKYVGYYWDFARLAIGYQRDRDLFARMLTTTDDSVTAYGYANYADRNYWFAEVTVPFAFFQRKLYGNIEAGVNHSELVNTSHTYPNNGYWNTNIKGFVQYDITDRLSVNATFAVYPRRTAVQSIQRPYWWLDLGLEWYMTRNRQWLLSLSVDDVANTLEHNQTYNYSSSVRHRHQKSVTQLVRFRLTWKIGRGTKPNTEKRAIGNDVGRFRE